MPAEKTLNHPMVLCIQPLPTYLPTYLMTKRSGLSGNFFDVVIKDFFARA